jgi:dTMP kinase
MNGTLITFEGIDGSVKSEQSRRLAERLRRDGHAVLLVHEPGGTPAGEQIRDIIKNKAVALSPKTELMLFAAARAELVETVIRPALERGEIVICDRFTDSTVAYQGEARGISEMSVMMVNAIATGHLRPHITFYLDVAVERGRVTARGTDAADRFDALGDDFLMRVRNAYLAMRHSGFHLISGHGTPASVEQRILTVLTHETELSPSLT